MNKTDLLARITLNPAVMVGKPVVRGTRLTVEHILRLLAGGMTAQEIMEEYSLSKEDVQACLMFAAEALADTTFMPLAE
jgi:uncharacterized protein (DUF433 family)